MLLFLVLPLLSHQVKASEVLPSVSTEVSEEEESSPLYSTQPIEQSLPPTRENSLRKTTKVAAIILALLATITVGLFASGANTGKAVEKK